MEDLDRVPMRAALADLEALEDILCDVIFNER